MMVASECAPVAQAGGLGEVVFGLSRELELRGHAVEIVIPKYDCMRYDQIYGLTVIECRITCPHGVMAHHVPPGELSYQLIPGNFGPGEPCDHSISGFDQRRAASWPGCARPPQNEGHRRTRTRKNPSVYA
jgi:hypothetical protein